MCCSNALGAGFAMLSSFVRFSKVSSKPPAKHASTNQTAPRIFKIASAPDTVSQEMDLCLKSCVDRSMKTSFGHPGDLCTWRAWIYDEGLYHSLQDRVMRRASAVVMKLLPCIPYRTRYSSPITLPAGSRDPDVDLVSFFLDLRSRPRLSHHTPAECWSLASMLIIPVANYG